MRILLPVVLGAGLLGACASHPPRPLVPAAELEALRARAVEGLRIEYARPGEPATAATPFDPTDGLDEGELVAVALTLDPELRVQRLLVGEAQALLVQASVWPNPELGLGVLPGLGSGATLGLGVELLAELLRPGVRDARQAFAAAGIDSARHEVLAAEVRVAARTRQARLAVVAGEQSALLLAEEERLRDQAVTLQRQRLELGEATPLDVALVELERAAIQREARLAQGEVESAHRELRRLLGLPPGAPLRLAPEPLTITVLEQLDDEALDRRLLAGRPELAAKEAEYRAAEAELRLALLGRQPGLRLGPAYERDLGGEQGLGLAAAIELPLLDRGQGAIEAARARRERLRAEYAALLHERRAAAFAARAALQRAHAELAVQELEIAPLLARTEALFAAALQAREITVPDWLTARSRAVQARREHLRAQVRCASARIDLDAATGIPLTRPISEPEAKR